MKNIKTIASILSLILATVLLSVFFAACGPEDPPPDGGDPSEVTVTELTIVKKSAKTDYYAGEAFDSKGMVLRAVWSDGRKETVVPAKCKVTPESALTALEVGTTKITFIYEGVSVDQPITVTQRNLVSVTASTVGLMNPVPTVGADLSKVKVTALYDDDSTEILTDYTMKIGEQIVEDKSDVKGLIPGTNVVTVEYAGKTYSFTLEAFRGFSVEAEAFDERYPTSGHVDTVSKKEYSGGAGIGWIYSGDHTVYKDVDFDAENLPTHFTLYYTASSVPEISVRFNGADGTEIARLTPPASSILASATVALSGDIAAGTHDIYLCFVKKGATSKDYMEVDRFTFSDPSDSVEKAVTAIEITKDPDRTVYAAGERFDPVGMEVTATFDDGTSAIVTDYTYSPDGVLTVADNKITVTYKDKTAEQTIEVVAKNVVKIEAEDFDEKNPPEANKQVQIISKPGFSGDKAIGWINPGNYTAYKGITFEAVPVKLTVWYAANNSSLAVTVKAGGQNGTEIAQLSLPDSKNVLKSVTVDIAPDALIAGSHDIYLCFGAGGADIDYFEFSD